MMPAVRIRSSRSRRGLWRFVRVACLVIALANVLSPPLSSRQDPQLNLHEITGITMGKIEYKVLLPHHDAALVDVLAADIAHRLSLINQRMSTYLPDSEISQFNALRTDEWFPVSEETAKVVQRGLEISAASQGAFDMTVKPLVDRWSFGPADRAFTIPDDEEIQRLLAAVGYQHVEARTNPPALRKLLAEIQLDLSAIAKGYAVDAVAEYLESQSVHRYFVEIGGELRVKGLRHDGLAWRVGIEAPAVDRRDVYRMIELTHGGLATSGNYRNFWEHQGRRYSHTIDPRTGKPIEHNLSSASVLVADCMTADALATAVMVLDRERGAELCRQFQAELFTISEGPGGRWQEWASAGFPPRIEMTVDGQSPTSWIRLVVGAVIVFALAFAAMAMGTLLGRKPIQGSCGGIGSGSEGCSLCGGQPSACEQSTGQSPTPRSPAISSSSDAR